MVLGVASTLWSLIPSAVPERNTFLCIKVWEMWCSSAWLSLSLRSSPQQCAPVPGLCALFTLQDHKRHPGDRWLILTPSPPPVMQSSRKPAARNSWEELLRAGLGVVSARTQWRTQSRSQHFVHQPIALIFLPLTSTTLILMLILTWVHINPARGFGSSLDKRFIRVFLCHVMFFSKVPISKLL